MSQTSESNAGECEQLEAALAKLIETQPFRLTQTFFRELSDRHTEGAATQACLRYLAQTEHAPGERAVSDWLARSGAYLPTLLNPEFLAISDARRAAAICRRHDPKFLARLQQILTEKHPRIPVILHALSIVSAFEEADMLLPLLRTLSHHESEHVRSNAAKTLCKLRPNRTLVERQLHSPDARTRANAIEGLWRLKTKEAEEILRSAATDEHHRVAVNALVGLYYQGDEEALDRLVEFSRHQSALHRAAAVWAFGQLGDSRAIPALEALGEDTRTMVRRKAAQVLAALRAKTVEPEPQSETTAKSAISPAA